MPDPTPTPTPPPAPKSIHSRSEQNRRFLDEVDRARKVAAAAVDPDNTATLADVDLAQVDLGYSPKVLINAGIPRFVAWWRAANQ